MTRLPFERLVFILFLIFFLLALLGKAKDYIQQHQLDELQQQANALSVRLSEIEATCNEEGGR